jgi:hypothetical protein
MIENEFVPLTPRRLHRFVEPASALISDAAADDADAHSISPAPEPGPRAIEIADRPVIGPEEFRDTLQSATNPDAARAGTDSDATRIRAAAIELAAAACERALRYAVDRNPRLLARFVDDALRAAGSPRRAIVRIATSATIAAAESHTYDLVADPELSPGDVFVDCDAGSLGATVGERAERLVRAAAS